MKERGIIFRPELAKAVHLGIKTQTRREVKPQPHAGVRPIAIAHPRAPDAVFEDGHGRPLRCPYGQPGDRLWVRETWAYDLNVDREETPELLAWIRERGSSRINFRGTGAQQTGCGGAPGRWRPSIHMPRWASRTTLEIIDVRVERLQEITEEDARAEGVEPAPFCKAGRPSGMEHVEAFEDLWDSINGAGSWDANPFVWRIEFRRVEP